MSTISLWNRDYENGVKVQALLGSNDDPSQNSSLGERVIPCNETWDIGAGDADVWYRTDRDPDHPTGSWSNYTRIENWGSDRREAVVPG